jgi:hypothetical protein
MTYRNIQKKIVKTEKNYYYIQHLMVFHMQTCFELSGEI